MRKFLFLASFLALLTGGGPPAAFGEEAADPSLAPASAPGAPGGVDQFWEDEKISVIFRSDYFENSKTFDGEKNLWGETAQFQSLPSLEEDVDGKINLRVIDPNPLNNTPVAFTLIEGYLAFHWGPVDLRVGKISVPWGRADGINPTDNLTPHDYTLQLPFDEDLRVGLAALKLDYYLNEEMDFTLFTTPFFEPSKFPLPAQTGTSYQTATPGQTLGNSEVGVKLNKTGGDWDWSASYFHGYRSLPDINLNSQSLASTVLGIQYGQIDVFGADFAHNFGPIAARGEAAYVHPEGTSAGNPDEIKPYVMAILGVDRTFDEEMNVNLQFISRFVQNFDPNAGGSGAAKNVAQLSALVNNEQDAESYELSFRVSDKWMNETLGAEVFGVVDLTRADCYIRPSVNYAFNDQLKGWVGWDIYRGDSNTQFGLLAPTQGFFTELRYSF